MATYSRAIIRLIKDGRMLISDTALQTPIFGFKFYDSSEYFDVLSEFIQQACPNTVGMFEAEIDFYVDPLDEKPYEVYKASYEITQVVAYNLNLVSESYVQVD